MRCSLLMTSCVFLDEAWIGSMDFEIASLALAASKRNSQSNEVA